MKTKCYAISIFTVFLASVAFADGSIQQSQTGQPYVIAEGGMNMPQGSQTVNPPAQAMPPQPAQVQPQPQRPVATAPAAQGTPSFVDDNGSLRMLNSTSQTQILPSTKPVHPAPAPANPAVGANVNPQASTGVTSPGMMQGSPAMGVQPPMPAGAQPAMPARPQPPMPAGVQPTMAMPQGGMQNTPAVGVQQPSAPMPSSQPANTPSANQTSTQPNSGY